ncbi:unnamed protein product [Lota lota]
MKDLFYLTFDPSVLCPPAGKMMAIDPASCVYHIPAVLRSGQCGHPTPQHRIAAPLLCGSMPVAQTAELMVALPTQLLAFPGNP